MTKTTEINQERSEKYRYLEKFSYGPKLVTLCSIAMIISILALMMSWMAVYDAIHAKAMIETDERYSAESYRQLEREYRLLQLKVDEHRAAMMAHGIDPNFHLEGESN